MEVDRALAYADLSGHVIDGHLPIAEPGEKLVYGVEDQVANVRAPGYFHHDDL
jgi:hypothetical protein